MCQSLLMSLHELGPRENNCWLGKIPMTVKRGGESVGKAHREFCLWEVHCQGFSPSERIHRGARGLSPQVNSLWLGTFSTDLRSWGSVPPGLPQFCNTYLEKPFTKKDLWSGSRCKPWVQTPVPQKKKKRRGKKVRNPNPIEPSHLQIHSLERT
jgi:hypothetical protein